MKSNLTETLLGAGVIVVALVFFSVVYRATDIHASSGGYELVAQFENITGIGTGSDVRIAGVKVGSVTGHRLDTGIFEAEVKMTIDPAVQLPADSSAKITSDGLLGQKFVAIEPGGEDNILSVGDRIEHTQGSVDIFDLIREFLFGGDQKADG